MSRVLHMCCFSYPECSYVIPEKDSGECGRDNFIGFGGKPKARLSVKLTARAILERAPVAD